MFGVLGALTGARRGPAGTIVWRRFTKVIQGVISNTQSVMMAVIVRSNMCRGFPQAVRMDYSGFDVGDGLPDHLADPVDVPGTRLGKNGSPAGGSLSTRLPGSRRPAGGAPGSKRLRRSWPGSPTAPGEPPGGASWKAAASRAAGMTTPPRRGSPARSSSAGWPRPEPPEAGLTDGRRIGSRAAPRLPRGRRADDRRDRHDRTRSRPGRAAEASPFSRRRGRQAVFRRIPPALGPLLP